MSAAIREPASALDVAKIRRDFPVFDRPSRGQRLAYLDTGASAQKPRLVIDAVAEFSAHSYANIHRGVYELSALATQRYEAARERVRRFLNAAEPREIVFVRNTTEAINLVAASWGRTNLRAGDEVLITEMEHHANIVPWQMLCLERGARLRVAPIQDDGALDMAAFERALGERTRLVAVAHVSNVLGTLNPLARIAELAHARGALLLVDGAQAAPRMPVDVRALGCDFYAFSGHKTYGPGASALFGRAALLETMPPYQTGGGMIASVSFEKTTFAPIPERFEAGTPAIAEVIGLAAALDYLDSIGLAAIERHEADLLAYGTRLLCEIPGLRLIGTAPEKTGVLSFVVQGVHAHDLGTILDREGVAIRAGHHCAQPLHARFGIVASARASLGLYNDREDLDRLAAGVRKSVAVFR
ncbi:MAG TPA: cysteine desulfurase [Myxococcota bacterium]